MWLKDTTDFMMMSWHGNAVHIAGHFWVETNDYRWIAFTNGSVMQSFKIFFAFSLNKLLNHSRVASDMRQHVILPWHFKIYNAPPPNCMYTVWDSLCFIVVRHLLVVPIFFRVTSLALGESYDCPSASAVTLKNMVISIRPVSHSIYWSGGSTNDI